MALFETWPTFEWPKMPPSVKFVEPVQTDCGAPFFSRDDEFVVCDRARLGSALRADVFDLDGVDRGVVVGSHVGIAGVVDNVHVGAPIVSGFERFKYREVGELVGSYAQAEIAIDCATDELQHRFKQAAREPFVGGFRNFRRVGRLILEAARVLLAGCGAPVEPHLVRTIILDLSRDRDFDRVLFVKIGGLSFQGDDTVGVFVTRLRREVRPV